MKTKLLFFFCLLLFLDNCAGQVTFQKNYSLTKFIDPGEGALGRSVRQCSDSGYITGGDIYFQGSQLIKLDKNGDVTWSKIMAIGGEFYSSYIENASDGGCVVSSTESIFTDFSNVGLTKFNINGDTLWAKLYPSVGHLNYSNCLAKTKDGGFIIGGNANFPSGHGNYGSDDGIFIRTDSSGNLIWNKSFSRHNANDGNHIFVTSVRQVNDGGFILTGGYYGIYAPGHLFLIKTDHTGIIEWSYNYVGTDDSPGYCVQQTIDSGYVVIGSSLMKTDKNGQPKWAKKFGGVIHDISFVQQTNDGGFIVSGNGINADSVTCMCLIKTNSSGDTLWTRLYTGVSSYSGRCVQQTLDSGFVISGNADDSLHSISIIKTDKYGNGACNRANGVITISNIVMQVDTSYYDIYDGPDGSPAICTIDTGVIENTLCFSTGIDERSDALNSLTIYPNPVGNEIRIKDAELGIAKPTVYIVNMLGQTVFQSDLSRSFREIKNPQSEINVSSLPSGIYLVRLVGEKESWVGRFVKE